MVPVSKAELLQFLREQAYAVEASVSPTGVPQAALVGVVVSDRFELFFDTLDSSRKAANLRNAPATAVVVGPTGPGAVRTVQYEGVADEPTGDELKGLLDLYFGRFPDGRARHDLSGIAYFRVKPLWLRYSDFSVEPPSIAEFRTSDLL